MRSEVDLMAEFRAAVERLEAAAAPLLDLRDGEVETLVSDLDLALPRGEGGADGRRDLAMLRKALFALADMRSAVDSFGREPSGRGVVSVGDGGGCSVGGVWLDAAAPFVEVERMAFDDGDFGCAPVWVPDWFGFDRCEGRWVFASDRALDPSGVSVRWFEER